MAKSTTQVINSVVFKAKGKTKGAVLLAKPIGAYCQSWAKTSKLNPGLYLAPSSSNAEKVNTYEVIAGTPAPTAKTQTSVEVMANASIAPSKATKPRVVASAEGRFLLVNGVAYKLA